MLNFDHVPLENFSQLSKFAICVITVISFTYFMIILQNGIIVAAEA